MILSLYGSTPAIIVHDLDMVEKLLSLVPSKLDRCKSNYTKSVLFWLTKSMIMLPSLDNMKQRRNMITAHLGLRMVSKYIPMFVEQCNNSLSSWKDSDSVV